MVVMVCLVTALPWPAADNDQMAGVSSEWRESLLKVRQEKDEFFKSSPTSPMAAVERLVATTNQGQPVFVVPGAQTVHLVQDQKKGSLFSLHYSDNRWFWSPLTPSVTISCLNGEEIVNPGSPIPEAAVFQWESWAIKAYPGKEQLILTVYNLKRPEYLDFSRLLYFPPDPVYAVPAILEKLAEPIPVEMVTSRDLKKILYRWGKVKFTLEGKSLELAAFAFEADNREQVLFIPFADATNGTETYAMGRFLEVTGPWEPGFILDFNHCYNPLCNYSPAFNCPLPPVENVLQVPIKAGELVYPHDEDVH